MNLTKVQHAQIIYNYLHDLFQLKYYLKQKMSTQKIKLIKALGLFKQKN